MMVDAFITGSWLVALASLAIACGSWIEILPNPSSTLVLRLDDVALHLLRGTSALLATVKEGTATWLR